jgi:hypothetical protein
MPTSYQEQARIQAREVYLHPSLTLQGPLSVDSFDAAALAVESYLSMLRHDRAQAGDTLPCEPRLRHSSRVGWSLTSGRAYGATDLRTLGHHVTMAQVLDAVAALTAARWRCKLDRKPDRTYTAITL